MREALAMGRSSAALLTSPTHPPVPAAPAALAIPEELARALDQNPESQEEVRHYMAALWGRQQRYGSTAAAVPPDPNGAAHGPVLSPGSALP